MRLIAMIPVTVYTRSGCHLCEQALEALRNLGRDFRMDLREIDIDTDPALAARYGEMVPVIAIANRPRLWGTIKPAWLRRLLRAESRGTAHRSENPDDLQQT